MFKKNKFRHFTFKIFFLLLLINPEQVFTQVKYTVLFPTIEMAVPQEDDHLRIAADANGTETARSFFKFEFNHLPKNAKVGTLNFKLYNLPNAGMSGFSSQIISVLKGTNAWTGNENALSASTLTWGDFKNNKEVIGRDELTKSSTSVTMKLKIPGRTPKYVSDFLPDGFLSLAARSPTAGQDKQFYSSKTAETSNNFSKKPKLLVPYEVDPYPNRSDWAQPFASAQHNSYVNSKKNASSIYAKVKKFPVPSNEPMVGADPTGALAIYKNQAIIFTQSATGGYVVKQLDFRGKELWSKEVDGIAKCWPLIDEQGRLYYISQAGKLTILDLNNSGDTLFFEALNKITNGQISAINNNATIGYDGTLYLTSDKGVLALSAYPELKIRWFYQHTSNERCGSVSLSPDESKAFLIKVNTTRESSRLVVLDNSDGNPLDESKTVLGGYKDGENFYIPAPVVQNDSRLLVLNGYDNGNQLFLFDYDRSGKITQADIIESGNTSISQPVVDGANNVFFVYNKHIARYDPSKPNKVDVFSESNVLNKASLLIADASGNIYAHDPYSTPKKVLGYNYSPSNKSWKNIFLVYLPLMKEENTKKNMVLAPDGTLYTHSTNTVYTIIPLQLFDGRDGQFYQTRLMKDGRTWMIENLNYKMEGTRVYDNQTDNQDNYGRTYTFKASKKACPSGWHLPSHKEWVNLAASYQSEKSGSKNALLIGEDSGFSLLLGGYYNPDMNGLDAFGSYGYYWGDRQQEKTRYFSGYLFDKFNSDPQELYEFPSHLGAYCRCIKSAALIVIDSRDGQTYKTVEMKDGRNWMAENLNYQMEGSLTYNNNPENGKIYGRLYTFDAANKACPSGWHLPTDGEWKKMRDIYGGIKPAYKALVLDKAIGFSAQYGGSSINRSFLSIGEIGYYWSSTESEPGVGPNPGFGWSYSFGWNKSVFQESKFMSDAYSCRCIQGTAPLIDSRDGQTYKTVQLKDGKIWMAENLNYKMEGSWTYDNHPGIDNFYGRLYTWEAATKACPSGWHLPSKEEWEKMLSKYGYVSWEDDSNVFDYYNALAFGGSSGFSALLGGWGASDTDFYTGTLGSTGFYWSSSMYYYDDGSYDESEAWSVEFDSETKKINPDQDYLTGDKSWGYSCRCIKD